MTIETIKAVLILNNIALGIGAAALAVCFLLWIRAETKLAKHGESWFFKPKARKNNAKAKTENAIAELAGAMEEIARAAEKAKYATQEVKDDGRQ